MFTFPESSVHNVIKVQVPEHIGDILQAFAAFLLDVALCKHTIYTMPLTASMDSDSIH